ncbi:hypothetical protein C8E87_1981 [Paractinoplanes brasiliensis]|uniref:Antitoxin Xre/MbcA/ParS-like toxin-binding domain-containing protein n=1 Tax=Paractinoplanes brasiliensis TaxID=52695 RepID=A0A4V6PSV2_9ACTN|nr:hypothetical protein C8E87_1981 [Actinoplanes brasiliensis]GID26895.1 hypothetical protein Abr02nite_18780 [Actinoplanes brasiliensis]
MLDLSRDAKVCAAVLDLALVAYLAGANSLGEYRHWLSEDSEKRRDVASRLAAARRVIAVFRAENRLALAEPWLREVGAAGDIPARVIRDKGDDEAIGVMVAEAASQWLKQRR